jgi:alanine racemase
MSHYFKSQPTVEEIEKLIEGFSSWLEIDLDAIGHNLNEVREQTGGEVIPCVKSNAYGHGMVPCVAYMMQNGVKRVLVAKLNEALQIREAGLECGIISLDPLFTDDQFDIVIANNITQMIYQEKPAMMLNKAANRSGVVADIWVKVDTGLGRVGVRWSDAVQFIENLCKLPFIKISGIFSTMSESSELDRAQVKRMKSIMVELDNKGIDYGVVSMASSNGVFHKPYTYFKATRPGLMLFGIYPEEEDIGHRINLKQALSWKARIEHVKTVEKGEALTYSSRFVAPERMKVATVHVGYYDGVPRGLTKKGKVNVEGKIRNVLGTVSVNHFLVDTSELDLEPGDVIELISREGENNALNTASLAGIMTYSLANQLHILTPRVYVKNGEPVAVSKLKAVEY